MVLKNTFDVLQNIFRYEIFSFFFCECLATEMVVTNRCAYFNEVNKIISKLIFERFDWGLELFLDKSWIILTLEPQSYLFISWIELHILGALKFLHSVFPLKNKFIVRSAF